MEELRAHATDWTQNIQNMSMDFRIPNPLEFNDPFLLQRRRWKRSERRRIRRGAQGTLGHWVRGGSENGHLPNRWAALSSSMSQLDTHTHPSLERAVVAKSRPRVSTAGGETVPRVGPGLRVDPAVCLQVEGRSFPHLLARSFSLPVTRSTLELDSAGAALQEGSLSGSESPFDSRSDVSSVSSSFLALRRFQPCYTVSSMEEGGTADINTAQEKNELTTAEKYGSVANNSCKHTPASGFHPLTSSLPPFIPPSHHTVLLPSPPLNIASSASCQLLDFFGENLAYIDESSDALSDQPAATEERKRRPRKPKRRSIRRQLPHRWSPLPVRRHHSEMQPPSNPPTPPPDSSLSDLPPSENHTGSAPTL